MSPLASTVACVAVVAACATSPARVSAAQRDGNLPPPPDRFVIIGCVSREAAGRGTPVFLITDTRGEQPTVYRLDGDAAALDFQVGHLVEAAGPLTVPARGGGGASARALVMKVERLSYLSKDCPSAKPAAK